MTPAHFQQVQILTQFANFVHCQFFRFLVQIKRVIDGPESLISTIELLEYNFHFDVYYFLVQWEQNLVRNNMRK